MSDETKKNDSESAPTKPEGDTDQSVTKIERRRSDAPAKASAEDDSPTAAHTPIAKGDASKKDTRDSRDGGDPKRVSAAGASSVRAPGASDGRRARASGESWGALGVLGLVLIGSNIAMMGVSSARYDATKEEKYSLSKKGTAHLLSTLTKPLEIKLYKPDGLATVDAFVNELRDLLDEYKRNGSGHVSYEIIVPDRLEGEQKTKAEAEAKDAGLHQQLLGAAQGGAANQATIAQGFLGIVLNYGGEHATLDQQDGFSEKWPQGVEFLLSNKIRELRDKEDKITHTIGYLQGHKEKGFQQLQQVFNKYFPYYKLEAVDLAKGEKAVNESLDGLIIAEPEEEITSKEQRRIDQFLMRGKAVAVFSNNVHIKDTDPSMTATFSGMGLDKLLAGYGIDFKSEMVIDQTQYWTPMMQLGNGIGAQLEPYPSIMVATGNGSDPTFKNDFAPFFRIQQLFIPFPVEITVDKARAGGDAVTVTTVAHTSKNIVTLTGTSISLAPSRDKWGQGATPKKDTREAMLGVSLEGPIKSAFPGGGEGVDGVPATATGGKARLFVLSSADFFANAFQESGKSPFAGQIPGMDPNMGSDEELMRYGALYDRARSPTLFVAKQTCDWISQETDLLAAMAKLSGDPELTYKDIPTPTPAIDEKPDSDSFKKKKTQWVEQIHSRQTMTKLVNTLGGGLLLGLFGIFRWWQRNNARASAKI